MKATQKIVIPKGYRMSIELDAPWGTFDVDVQYEVHDGDRFTPRLYELIGVWLGGCEVTNHLNADYILDLCADDFLERQR